MRVKFLSHEIQTPHDADTICEANIQLQFGWTEFQCIQSCIRIYIEHLLNLPKLRCS